MMENLHSTSLDALRARLLDVLTRAREDRNFRDPAIRDIAGAIGREAKATELPPERLLVLLKELFRARELSTMGDWFRRVLTDRVIVWAIDAYYGLDGD
jgi:hypothetical protein